MASTVQAANEPKRFEIIVPFDKLFAELYPDKYRGKHSLCPFHEDNRPSFQVEQDHGYCHAGCTPQGSRVPRWSAIDLWMAAHGVDFPAALEAVGRRTQAPADNRLGIEWAASTYDYLDENGAVLYRIARFQEVDGSKQIRPFHLDASGSWQIGLGDVRRVPFNLPDIIRASPNDWVLILEGEKCARAAADLGFTATCNVGGAGKWPGLAAKYGYNQWFEKRNVAIFPDNDLPGRRHASQVARSLEGIAQAVVMVELPDLPPKGDLVDYLAVHDRVETAGKILELIEAAQRAIKPRRRDGIISARDLMLMEDTEPIWVIQDLIPEGLTMLAGPPKTGKSWLTLHLALTVAAGGLVMSRFPTNQGRVLLLALEDTSRRLRKRITTVWREELVPDGLAIAREWPTLEVIDGPNGLLQLRKWLEAQHGAARLVIIDTLQKLRGRAGKKNDSLYAADYHDLEGLQRLAGEFGVGILVVHHLNKAEHADPFNAVSGTTGMTGACDTIMILAKTNRTGNEAQLLITGRDIQEQKARLLFDADAGTWTWDDTYDESLTGPDDALVELIKGLGKPVGTSEILAAMPHPISRQGLQKKLGRLVAAGTLARPTGNSRKYIVPDASVSIPAPASKPAEDQDSDPDMNKDRGIEEDSRWDGPEVPE